MNREFKLELWKPKVHRGIIAHAAMSCILAMDDLAGLRSSPRKQWHSDSSSRSRSPVSSCGDDSVVIEEEDEIMEYESVVFRSWFKFFSAFMGLTFYDSFSLSSATKVLFLLVLGVLQVLELYVNIDDRMICSCRMFWKPSICAALTMIKIKHHLLGHLETRTRLLHEDAPAFLF